MKPRQDVYVPQELAPLLTKRGTNGVSAYGRKGHDFVKKKIILTSLGYVTRLQRSPIRPILKVGTKH